MQVGQNAETYGNLFLTGREALDLLDVVEHVALPVLSN